MKAIPTSVKAQFFAMYLGQKAKCIRHFRAERNSIGKDGTLCMSPSILADIHEGTFSADDFYLELRSVSDLTDEEKYYLAYLCGWIPGKVDMIKMGESCIANFLDDLHLSVYAIDYLSSIGVLLPFIYLNEDKKPVTLSVDELIGMKWAVIKK